MPRVLDKIVSNGIIQGIDINSDGVVDIEFYSPFIFPQPELFTETEKQNIFDAYVKLSQFGGADSETVFSAIESSGGPLVLKSTSGPSNTPNLLNYEVLLNTLQPSISAYIDSDGIVRGLSLERLLIHETIHAVIGHEDIGNEDFFAANPDYMGDTVRLTNSIMAHPGLDEPERVSYFGGISQNIFPVGTGLTDITFTGWDGSGTSFGQINVANAFKTEWDTSNNYLSPNSNPFYLNDLMLGSKRLVNPL